jgi:hypothetical protein
LGSEWVGSQSDKEYYGNANQPAHSYHLHVTCVDVSAAASYAKTRSEVNAATSVPPSQRAPRVLISELYCFQKENRGLREPPGSKKVYLNED